MKLRSLELQLQVHKLILTKCLALNYEQLLSQKQDKREGVTCF